MTANDIHFYHPIDSDGGDIDVANEVTSTNFIADVSASEAASGSTKYQKFYIKNTNANDIVISPLVGLSSFSLGGDYFTILQSTGNGTIVNTENFDRRYGVAKCTGNSINNTVPIEFEDPSIYQAIFQPGDIIVFFEADGSRKYSSTILAVTSTSLETVDDIDFLHLKDLYVATVVSGVNIGPGEYLGFWLQQVIPENTTEYLSSNIRISMLFDAE